MKPSDIGSLQPRLLGFFLCWRFWENISPHLFFSSVSEMSWTLLRLNKWVTYHCLVKFCKHRHCFRFKQIKQIMLGSFCWRLALASFFWEFKWGSSLTLDDIPMFAIVFLSFFLDGYGHLCLLWWILGGLNTDMLDERKIDIVTNMIQPYLLLFNLQL